MAQLWNSVTPPAHTEPQVALSGLGKNAILCAGLYGVFLVVQATLPSATVTVDVFDQAAAPSHTENKVAVAGLSKDGILPGGDYGSYRLLSGLLPSDAAVGNPAVSAGLAAVSGTGTVPAGNPAASAGQATVSATGNVPAAEIRETQAGLEWAGTNPPASTVRETQAALEEITFPPVNEIWQTQVCLEVLFPADGFGPVTARNYAYTGLWART